jgi:hypothetical protein
VLHVDDDVDTILVLAGLGLDAGTGSGDLMFDGLEDIFLVLTDKVDAAGVGDDEGDVVGSTGDVLGLEVESSTADLGTAGDPDSGVSVGFILGRIGPVHLSDGDGGVLVHGELDVVGGLIGV